MPLRQPRLSFGLLRGFSAVAQNLSFTLAARELCLTQSAVSRQIQTLEAQLGTTLFRRDRKKLELTEAGHALYRAVTDASRLIDGAVGRLHESRARAELSVASCGSFASCWLVPRLARFIRLFPDYDVRVEAVVETVSSVPKGFDVAIQYFKPGQTHAGWAKLLDDHVLPVCSPALLRSSARPVRAPDDLAQHVQIQLTSRLNSHPTTDWMRWREHLQLEHLKPAGTLSFSSYEHVLHAALSGHGVALGRLPLVAAHLRDGTLEAPLQDAMVAAGAWHAMASSAAGARPHVSQFLDWLSHESAQDAGPGLLRPPPFAAAYLVHDKSE